MAPPPLTGKSLILHPRILPNGAGADTIGAVIVKCPSGALHPGGLGRRTKEATMTTKLVALVLLCLSPMPDRAGALGAGENYTPQVEVPKKHSTSPKCS